MIVFPNKYPYEITNTSGGTLCGIPSLGVLALGPANIESTKEFYESYAEEAFSYLLDGIFTAVDSSGTPLAPYLAASSFTNMRAKVSEYELGARVVQSYTKFSSGICIPGFIDEEGHTVPTGQYIMQGCSGIVGSSGGSVGTNASSAVVEETWTTGTVYTKTVSVPGTTPGGSYSVNVALSPEFMQEIASNGGVLITNAWCLVNGELIISAKVL